MDAGEGQRLLAGRYALGERLGRGGMGTVWQARDELLDREVAVKELTVSHLPEEELEILQSRMKREARAAARIKHPGVITIHDVLEQDGRPWIVMELIDGRSLADVISQDGTLTPREAAGVGTQVLAALHRGHQLGVLHRDVKPANVLLEHGTGRVVLLDFGIATFEGSTELTRPGDLVGSPDYLAPERAQGERPGPASDLWGLGATLYAAVEGESPFKRSSPITTLAAVVGEPLPEPRRAGALGPVLAALMAKDPADRPGADQALRMLAEVTAGHTLEIKAAPAPRPQVEPTQSVPVVDRSGPDGPDGSNGPVAAPEPPTARLTRRRFWPRVLVAGVVTALLAGGATYAMTGKSSEDPNPPVSQSSPAPMPAPKGYRWTDDPGGFRFLLPTEGGTWVRSVENTQIYYSPDNRQRYLQFAVAVGQPLEPIAHFRELETTVKSGKDYRQVALTKVDVNGAEGAVWEFTYTKDGIRRHVKDVEFRDAKGTSYTLLVATPDNDKDWVVGQRILTTVLNEFVPTR
ncbi:serine/threonine protein kinase [Kitasatospora gansuensis]|uniref:non-specific serine/threonine protein kinase n=1 Tax=Kitasatospora gansuensis TaxID=258050 RepID=A0A7W7SF49_9ACTN|nr:serine/threonine-protein kinase [Kitasatospora gansuensis]MBB4948773.1 serine/threonine protein kinase [Kitasatospora gansuensis]